MENKSTIKKSADARVVQAVRRLKSTRPKDDNMEVRKNQEDVKHPTIIKGKPGYINNNNQGQNQKNSSNLTLINPLNKKTMITNNDSIINNNNHNSIILNNNNNNTGSSIPKSRDINKSQSKIKITIDGSQKPSTSSTNKTTTNKVFDYETLKKYKKRKISDFQKNLLSKKSLEKYKEE